MSPHDSLVYPARLPVSLDIRGHSGLFSSYHDDSVVAKDQLEFLFVDDVNDLSSDQSSIVITDSTDVISVPVFVDLLESTTDLRRTFQPEHESCNDQQEPPVFSPPQVPSTDKDAESHPCRMKSTEYTTEIAPVLEITTDVLEGTSVLDCRGEATSTVPDLRFHFENKQGIRRKHRHVPRHIKFVYESPLDPQVNPVKNILNTEGTPGNVNLNVVGSKPAKDVAEGITNGAPIKTIKGKGDKKPAKKEKSNKLNSQPPPPLPVSLPKDAAVPELVQKHDPPIWFASHKAGFLVKNKKPLIVIRKRCRQWIMDEKLFGLNKNESTLPKWSKTGQRFHRRYGLRTVIKDPRTLGLFFVTKRKNNIMTSLKSLVYFAEQSTQLKMKIMTIPNLIKRLISLICFHPGPLRRLGLVLLASLSEVNIFIRYFLDCAGLERLSSIFFRNEERDTDVWTTLLIRNISQNSSIQKQLIKLGYLNVLLNKVSAKDQHPDIVKHILQTLLFLCKNDRIRRWLVLNGALAAILDMLLSAFKYIQYLTLILVTKLLRTPNARAIYRFERCGGVTLLIDFVTDITQRKLFPLATKVLEYIFLSPAIARKANESGTYRRLMETIVSRPFLYTPSLQEFTLNALCKAAAKEDERRTMHTLGYEHHVISFLKSPFEAVQVAALKVVAVMCIRKLSQNTCYDLGAHRVILFLMEGRNHEVREWSYNAIAYLIFRNKKVSESFINKNFIAYLIQTLTDTTFETRNTKGNALLCAILLRNAAGVREMLKVTISSLIPAWLIDEKKRLRIYAAVSLSLFVRDSESRSAFEQHRGYQAIYLSSMMDQYDIEQQRHLCYGIATLAVNEQIVWDLVNFGCLTPVLTLKNANDRVSQGYVAFAVRRLISFDNTLKFALTRHLNDSDRIPHGFHDQGQLAASNPFKRVEVHLRQPLTARQTVVYISLPKKLWRRVQTPSCCVRKAQDRASSRCWHESPERHNTRSLLGLKKTVNSVPAQNCKRSDHYNPHVPVDNSLRTLIKQARLKTRNHHKPRDRIAALTSIVVNQMGGACNREKSYDDTVDIGLSLLRSSFSAPSVPLGFIVNGNALHRALLFKVLADVCDLKVSLTSWDYNAATIGVKQDGVEYVLDLMYEIGCLLPKGHTFVSMGPSITPDADGCTRKQEILATDVPPLQKVYSASRSYLLESLRPRRIPREVVNKDSSDKNRTRLLPHFCNHSRGQFAAGFQTGFRRKITHFSRTLFNDMSVKEGKRHEQEQRMRKEEIVSLRGSKSVPANRK